MSRYLGFKALESENYFFVSYNSEDSDRIAPSCLKMHNEGVPLWYDEGLDFGDQWEEIIGEKISNSLAMIFFFTVGMLEKENSYAIKEFRIAQKQKKKIIILLVDPLAEDLWARFPRRCSFLDDIDQTHSSLDIESLIQKLKDESEQVIRKASQPINKLNFNEPVIVDSEYLLNKEFFTALQISQRHVELDLLTIDGNLFPEALEVEGDASTWEDMITDTAECSANLIVNNRIVGYLDFFPVTPEDYELLKTKPFDESYIAFYAFGGRFDIFVSMFSIDPNYTTPKNIILFIHWMIERILIWKENEINIGKIEFSLYSKHQAKVLENLGFKLVLTNKLKGMLYEAKVSDLLSNNLVKTRFSNSNFNDYKYKIQNKNDVPPWILDKCHEIMLSLHVKNGGILQYENALDESDVILYAEYINRVVGYACLKQYNVFKDGLYVEQIAITANHQNLGIGKGFVERIIKYAKENGYKAVFANCKKTNLHSHRLFISCGFKEFDMSKEQYLGIGINEDDIEKNVALTLDL